MSVSFVLSAAFLMFCLFCPAACADGVRAGLSLAAERALPALFPFFTAAALLTESGLADALGRLFGDAVARFFRLPRICSGVILLGLCGGYPVGAAGTAALLETHRISRDTAARLACFTNCASPAFCIALCGTPLFGSAQIGVLLYLTHIASALLLGLILTRRAPQPAAASQQALAASPVFSVAFCHAVQQAAQTALTVTAFLTVFSVVRTWLLPLSDSAVLSALLELTYGIDALSRTALSPMLLLPLCAFLLGFGGLSVQFQIRSLLAPYAVPLRKLLPAKLLHGALSALLILPVALHLPVRAAVFAPLPASVPAPRGTAVLFLLALTLLTFCGGKRRGNLL